MIESVPIGVIQQGRCWCGAHVRDGRDFAIHRATEHSRVSQSESDTDTH